MGTISHQCPVSSCRARQIHRKINGLGGVLSSHFSLLSHTTYAPDLVLWTCPFPWTVFSLLYPMNHFYATY
jgi:hypothetical protein